MKNFDFDKVWIGLVSGLIAPLIVFWLYYLFADQYTLKRVNVSLCMVINLAPFYLTLNNELYKATKGVLISTVAWALVIAYLSFFTNYLHVL